MKTKQNKAILLFILGLFLFSYNFVLADDDYEKKYILKKELPVSAQKVLENRNVSTQIKKIEKDDNKFEVKLRDDSEFEFDQAGNLLKSKIKVKEQEQEQEHEDSWSERNDKEEGDDKKEKKDCTFEYAPVCGKVDTEAICIKAPCPEYITKTFKNKCALERVDADILYDGVCQKDGELLFDDEYEKDDYQKSKEKKDKYISLIDLPKSAQIILENQKAVEQIKYIEKDDNKFEVKLRDGSEFEFDQAGNLLKSKIKDEDCDDYCDPEDGDYKYETNIKKVEYGKYTVPVAIAKKIIHIKSEKERREVLQNYLHQQKTKIATTAVATNQEKIEKENESIIKEEELSKQKKVEKKSNEVFSKFDYFSNKIEIFLNKIDKNIQNINNKELKNIYQSSEKYLNSSNKKKAEAWLLFNSLASVEDKNKAVEILQEVKRLLQESKEDLKKSFQGLKKMVNLLK